MAKRISETHDEMLEHEHRILSDVEALGDLRNALLKGRDMRILMQQADVILNAILYDVESYKGWIEEQNDDLA